MNWQPIETAPKDKTWVLIFCPAFKWKPKTYQEFNFEERCYVAAYWDDGWYPEPDENYGRVKPTHWMPLPPPPEAP